MVDQIEYGSITVCVCVCRDASFGNCTFNLTVLDCLKGIRKVSINHPPLINCKVSVA